ncbi:MAG: hypothetical protein MRK02_11065 [Candidatus Scalindua sp.]|nr:hypothetical protein [Candidatus Scalindua sp.]
MRISQIELAKKLNVSLTSLQHWRYLGMPFQKTKEGRIFFNLKKVESWLAEKEKKTSHNEVFKRARLAVQVYQGKILEKKYNERKAEVVKADDVQKAEQDFKTKLKTSLRKIPEAIKEAFEAKGIKADLSQVEKIISREIEEVLQDV